MKSPLPKILIKPVQFQLSKSKPISWMAGGWYILYNLQSAQHTQTAKLLDRKVDRERVELNNVKRD